MPHALLIDDSAESLLTCANVFKDLGFSLDTAQSVSAGRDLLLRKMPDVVLLGAGIVARKKLPRLQSILTQPDFAGLMEIHAVVSADDSESRRCAEDLGASCFHDAPLNLNALQSALEAYLETVEEHTERREVHESGRGLLVGESEAMRALYRLIRKASTTDAAILLHGESGTGKELVSRTIHELSGRAKGPFMAMNSGAVPEDLAESELFGHEKGAFTGADQARDGIFERASGGTLLLDEITEMPEALQVTLLRVLESGEFKKLGSQDTRHSDFRLIAACNRDPAEAMAQGHLREDLFYRIAQFPMHLPPLRERGADIELLAKHFLAQEIDKQGPVKTFKKEALDLLRLRQWPGNVRELRNVVARAYLLAGEKIRAEDIPDEFNLPNAAGEPTTAASVEQLAGQPLEDVERKLIIETLDQCAGNKRKTAEVLGISPKTLYARLKTYGIEL